MSSRHKRVERSCDNCGASYMALEYRLKNGQGRYCSLKCFNEWQKENLQRGNIGKENAFVYFQKNSNRHVAQWVDEETGKLKQTTWANWAWEMNFGEIPDGYVVRFKDGDATNIVLDNLYLAEWGEWSEAPKMTVELRKKLSKAHKGKKLSKEHKKNIGLSVIKRWENGEFDTKHKGKYNYHYKDGKSKPYPPEYYKIRPFIKDRDNYTCQICGKSVWRSRHGHVHHIDGDKNNNDQDNLILFCSSCHSKVHHPDKKTPETILAFSSQLKF